MAKSIQDKISNLFSSLSPRDRMIYIGMFALVLFCILCFAGFMMVKTLQEKETTLKSLELEVVNTAMFVEQIEMLREENTKYEKNFADNKEDFQSFLLLHYVL